ncbi:hypothetical protein TR51_06440 [Kitasatospora griseola]|uniref:Uncharacterized protein n=1 Tax=Kitasatospora griseola TaxID=2064 RepID=A0A0D0PX78_KITGR|nr:hypothetical protein [Kitasatospora griseola]KIQ67024.1 hypothetical protein TR51_06440 [Kitasatospora griseola]
MTDLTARQRLANHLAQLNLGDTHIAYDIGEFEREIREQMLAENARPRAKVDNHDRALADARATSYRRAALDATDVLHGHGPDAELIVDCLQRRAAELRDHANRLQPPTTEDARPQLDLDGIRPQLDEMRTAVGNVVQTFLDNCPEGFDAATVADAIVDVCSDEMLDLYRARAERDEYRDLLTREGYLNDPNEGVCFVGTGAPISPED